MSWKEKLALLRNILWPSWEKGIIEAWNRAWGRLKDNCAAGPKETIEKGVTIGRYREKTEPTIPPPL